MSVVQVSEAIEFHTSAGEIRKAVSMMVRISIVTKLPYSPKTNVQQTVLARCTIIEEFYGAGTGFNF